MVEIIKSSRHSKITGDFAERFYFEDFSIGYFRPWFNFDSER